MSFSAYSVRWLKEKILLFVFILIAMLLLLDQDNQVMESTITGVVRQRQLTVLAIGLLCCFALHYPRLKIYYTGYRKFFVLDIT